MSTPAAPTSRRWLWRALVLGAVAAGLWYVFSVVLRPVAVVAAAKPGRAINAVPGSVEVKAEYLMELKSEVGGRIVASVLDPGRPVAKDEVLVQLDTGDADLEIERITNEVAAARRRQEVGSTLRAEVENKRDSLAEMERAVKAGAKPLADFEKEQRLYQQLVQRMDLDEVNLRLALENFENALRAKQREKAKMTIVAPTDGVISEVSLAARVGDLIGRDNVIATLISSSRAVEAKISEENFAGLKLGQKASVRFLGYGNKSFPATITKILPTANPETQRYTVHLAVDLEVDKLVPGLTGEVTIVIGQREGAAVIPRRALRGSEVFVVTDGRIELRKVELGYVSNTDVEILSGLALGDLVIVEELDLYRPGSRVRTKLLQ
ncbi:Macrolide export protein MacA [Lacunisphaera limnophila]|uniref:Macrolide export protein MacA n=1 Tax=Lacunisphaera limnophila TaxID=1838286 RepID=A0A1D8AVT0_9BACT|nr:efflux RND transporter periplasmic adaptor subunit [Lacunisphaera limnophila]AOS45008.1 Macrolide export protein MacA [Lacunisphaera limnophila]